jgi:hypothetical protein
MNDTAHIEDTLRTQLPAALHACVPSLAAVIVQLQEGWLTPEEAAERFQGEVFSPLRWQITGQTLLVEEVRIEISPGGDTIAVGNLSNVKGVAVGAGAFAIGELTIPIHVDQQALVPIPSKRVFMAPNRPADFVPRPVEFEQIVTHLLDSGTGRVAISAALQGAGGFGKTTLAAAVCHDARVRAAFHDGVLWVTLSEKPTVADIVGRIEDLVEELTDKRPGFISVEAATARLSEVLGERKLLLVIDDVWDLVHDRRVRRRPDSTHPSRADRRAAQTDFGR